MMTAPKEIALKKTQHIPIMPAEVLEALKAENGGSFLDCTLGGGGHTHAILGANQGNTVVAVDRDLRSIERAKDRLVSFGERVEVYHAQFSDLGKICQPGSFDGILADLGVSTDQLKEGRGFSFFDTGPLDMRMDASRKFSAREIVNTFPEPELRRLLQTGGVGREAHTIARAIVTARPIEATRELARVINRALNGRGAKRSINPATVAFQALRIAVNEELKELEALLGTIPRLMRPGGRLVIISFHSLEDELVTGTLRRWHGGVDTPPANWPAAGRVCSERLGRLLTKKATTPTAEEVLLNPSSRSARLRVFEFNTNHDPGGFQSHGHLA